MLATYQGTLGDWHKLFNSPDDIDKVTSDDLQRILVKYFVPSGRTMVYTAFPGLPAVQTAGVKQ
jgi:hypothetical protein